MKDADCTEFLQWALPRLGLRWPGFRRVRGQVCKRLRRRIAELGLRELVAYRALLETRRLPIARDSRVLAGACAGACAGTALALPRFRRVEETYYARCHRW